MERKGLSVEMLACLATLLISGACAPGDGGPVVGIKEPFAGPTATTVSSFKAQVPGAGISAFTVSVVDQKSVGGRVYNGYKTSIEGQNEYEGLKVWIDTNDADEFTFIGFEEVNILTVEADEPYAVRVDGPVDRPESITVNAHIATADDPTPRPGTAQVDYVKVTDDGVLDTPFGTITGVSQFTGTVTMTGEGVPILVQDFPIEMSVWYHPAYGVVKADVPIFAVGMDIDGEYDCGDPLSDGYNSIQKVGVVKPGGESFRLSVYDCAGDFTADKETHAKMALELRFADDDMARTTTPPPVVETFGTVFGYFPETLVQSPVSIFHPEENGQGFVYWYALVDQAAKNEYGSNGISYRIEVAPADYMSSAVRATARIVYKTWLP